jgi:hypothetical protein
VVTGWGQIAKIKSSPVDPEIAYLTKETMIWGRQTLFKKYNLLNLNVMY